MSDAVGGVARPLQIERVAKAEAKAEVIKANARIEVSDIEQRAILRMVREEGKKQENIGAITLKSLEYLPQEAHPENIDEDWLTHFFERYRSYTNDETREIWAKVLEGEASKANSFSRRAIDVLATMDAADAALFSRLCSRAWTLIGAPVLAIRSNDTEQLKVAGIGFADLVHLDKAGLISFEALGGFSRQGFGPIAPCTYFDKTIFLSLRMETPHCHQPATLSSAAMLYSQRPARSFGRLRKQEKTRRISNPQLKRGKTRG
ncbi:DUF2806 domain-containing protein [Mesorhizobium qingshengii]|uniref:DUF2806 domain-containing protein n=1 Tax=Mesorhizobium qingshengii TaxID=1165689 RepID=UPI00115FBCC7|nr:DUF2806 domain-containing protein [Mesorhizobium qingshengii]